MRKEENHVYANLNSMDKKRKGSPAPLAGGWVDGRLSEPRGSGCSTGKKPERNPPYLSSAAGDDAASDLERGNCAWAPTPLAGSLQPSRLPAAAAAAAAAAMNELRLSLLLSALGNRTQLSPALRQLLRGLRSPLRSPPLVAAAACAELDRRFPSRSAGEAAPRSSSSSSQTSAASSRLFYPLRLGEGQSGPGKRPAPRDWSPPGAPPTSHWLRGRRGRRPATIVCVRGRRSSKELGRAARAPWRPSEDAEGGKKKGVTQVAWVPPTTPAKGIRWSLPGASELGEPNFHMHGRGSSSFLPLLSKSLATSWGFAGLQVSNFAAANFLFVYFMCALRYPNLVAFAEAASLDQEEQCSSELPNSPGRLSCSLHYHIYKKQAVSHAEFTRFIRSATYLHFRSDMIKPSQGLHFRETHNE
ncbi:uncharacterized protein LOC128402317 [Podarcis raffonei]|uniref:uncharacterized protein LOC128402317 n=1 Tax=Podarcis raffonei TaxID=65483 RepID=UPI0023292843|nr:uncharacterized protein LOC128402317 [Podarcis raffonei]